jgi:hypothetical protein
VGGEAGAVTGRAGGRPHGTRRGTALLSA